MWNNPQKPISIFAQFDRVRILTQPKTFQYGWAVDSTKKKEYQFLSTDIFIGPELHNCCKSKFQNNTVLEYCIYISVKDVCLYSIRIMLSYQSQSNTPCAKAHRAFFLSYSDEWTMVHDLSILGAPPDCMCRSRDSEGGQELNSDDIFDEQKFIKN